MSPSILNITFFREFLSASLLSRSMFTSRAVLPRQFLFLDGWFKITLVRGLLWHTHCKVWLSLMKFRWRSPRATIQWENRRAKGRLELNWIHGFVNEDSFIYFRLMYSDRAYIRISHYLSLLFSF
jgi:hypothetical protein